MQNENKNICLISNTLPIDDKMVGVWNRLNDELAKENYSLCLLTTTVHTEINFNYILIPFALHEFSDLEINIDNEIYSSEQKLALEFTDKETEWFNLDKNNWYKHFQGYYKCKAFHRLVIRTLKPSVIIPWQNSLPQSNILKRLAIEYSIPHFIIERGMLPDTLSLEKDGHVALSEIFNNYSIRKVISENKNDSDYSKIREHYLSERPLKYQQTGYSESKNILEGLSLDERPLLVYFSNIDSSVGIYPRNNYLSRKTSPYFNNMEETVKQLAEYAKLNNCYLIVKQHPSDNKNYYEYECENVKILKDFSYHCLMEAADVLIFSCSTLQFESLFYEKPVVLLTQTELSGSNIGYEITADRDLPLTLSEAMSKSNFLEKNKNAKSFIHWVSNYFLFAYDEKIPIKNKLSDLARHFAAVGVKETKYTYDQKFQLLDNFLSTIGYDRAYSRNYIQSEINEQNPTINYYNAQPQDLVLILKELFETAAYSAGSQIPLSEVERIFELFDDPNGAEKYFARVRRDASIKNPDGGNNFFHDISTMVEQLTNQGSQSKSEYFYYNKNRSFEGTDNDYSEVHELLLQVEEFIEAENFDDAEKILLKILSENELDVNALNDLAVIAILTKNKKKAFNVLDKVLTIDPTNEIALDNYQYLKESFENAKINNS